MTVYVIGNTSGQQWATGSYILGESEGIRRLLTAQGWRPSPHIVQGPTESRMSVSTLVPHQDLSGVFPVPHSVIPSLQD